MVAVGVSLGCLSVAGGVHVGCPWSARGVSMCSAWGVRKGARVVSVSPWGTHGVCVVCLWDVRGVPLGGLSVSRTWVARGSRVGCTWFFPESSVGRP